MIVIDVNDDPNGFNCHSCFCLLLDCTRSHLTESFIFTTRIAAAAAAVAATATAKAAATLTLMARIKLVQDSAEKLESRPLKTIELAQSIESILVVVFPVDGTLMLLGSVGWVLKF